MSFLRLRARWQTRPPTFYWYCYARWGELPPQWHPWMLDDLLTPGWSRRRVARLFTAATAMVCIVTLSIWPIRSFIGLAEWNASLPQLVYSSICFLVLSYVLGSAAGAVASGTKWARRGRVRVLANNGYDETSHLGPLGPSDASG